MASDSEPPRPDASVSAAPSTTPPKPRSVGKRLFGLAVALLLVYLVVAYLVLPRLWKFYYRRHPSLEDIPGITHTASGIPGDPLNVALIGTKVQVIQIMQAAKWYVANPLDLHSDLE